MNSSEFLELKNNSFSFAFHSHFDAQHIPNDSGGGGELFEKFQQKQKFIKDNPSAVAGVAVGGSVMGGKR